MSFLACIQTAVDTKKLTSGKAAEAETAFTEIKARMLAAGESEATAEYAASHEALKQVMEGGKAKRWQTIQTMRRQHDAYNFINSHVDVVNSLGGHSIAAKGTSLMQRADLVKHATEGQLMRAFHAAIDAFHSRKFGLVKPLENMDDATHGVWGTAKTDTGKAVGEAILNVNKQIAEHLREQGVTLPDNEYKAPQRLSSDKVFAGGKGQFIADMLADGTLDWEAMRYNNKPIPLAEREMRLENAWSSITTDGMDEAFSGKNAMSLANRLGRERFLIYKSADAWLKINEKYGDGNIYEQMVHQIQMTSGYIGLMSQFGPDPEVGMRFAEQAFQEKVAALTEGMKPAQRAKILASRDREIKTFQDQGAILTHSVPQGNRDPIISVANAARLVNGVGMLGGMMLTAVTDPAYGMSSRIWTHQYALTANLLPRYLKAIVGYKNFRQELINDGIGIHTLGNDIHGVTRYVMGLEGPNWYKTISNLNYRITGTSMITEIGRGLMGLDFQRILAKHKDVPFADHPLNEIFRNLGVTAEDWKAVQNTALYEPEYFDGSSVLGKGQYVRPVDMIAAAKTRLEKDAAQKFAMAQELFIRGGTPMPDLRSQAFAGGAVSPATFFGQVHKNSAQFMMFPASIMFNFWRTAMQAEGFQSKAARLGLLVGLTTAFGAFSQQIKNLNKGYDPESMDNAKFWAHAAAIGGGGSILGDFVYNNLIASNTPLSARTPMGELGAKAVAPIREGWKAYLMGDQNAHPGKAGMDLMWQTIPKPAPFGLAMQRMIYDPMLKQADPAAYYKKRAAEQQRLQANGQEAWWGMDQ